MARHFTVEEANTLIPTLTSVLEDLRGIHGHMRAVAEQVAEFEMRAKSNGHGGNTSIFEPGNDLAELRKEIEQRLLYLQGVGVQLKDIQNGVVDFPTRMFGREVYLCWRLGEPTVAHWHDIEGGYAGRQPL